jgi:hypothetical protein
MSKGPGRVQRAIAALIEAEPDGAWPYEELRVLIYGREGRYRANKSAIGRALTKMQLPGSWRVMQAVCFNDRRWWLHDPCRLEAWRKMAPGADPSHWRPGGIYFGWCEEAKRRRDAKSPPSA